MKRIPVFAIRIPTEAEVKKKNRIDYLSKRNEFLFQNVSQYWFPLYILSQLEK